MVRRIGLSEQRVPLTWRWAGEREWRYLGREGEAYRMQVRTSGGEAELLMGAAADGEQQSYRGRLAAQEAELLVSTAGRVQAVEWLDSTPASDETLAGDLPVELDFGPLLLALELGGLPEGEVAPGASWNLAGEDARPGQARGTGRLTAWEPDGAEGRALLSLSLGLAVRGAGTPAAGLLVDSTATLRGRVRFDSVGGSVEHASGPLRWESVFRYPDARGHVATLTLDLELSVYRREPAWAAEPDAAGTDVTR